MMKLLVDLGGLLGAGEKDLAVLFDSVRLTTTQNNKWQLVMNTTTGSLKNAPTYKYDPRVPPGSLNRSRFLERCYSLDGRRACDEIP
jgi:hypothetical protein